MSASATCGVAASVLRMRSGAGWEQPVVGVGGDVLAWNGEWFAGPGVPDSDACDTAAVLELASGAAATAATARGAAEAVAAALATRVRGPFALALWVARLETLVYCRDPLGRRSLVARRSRDSFAVASAAPAGGGAAALGWDEVPADGVFFVCAPRGGARDEAPAPAPADEPAPSSRATWPRDALLDPMGWPPLGSWSEAEARVDDDVAASLLLDALSESVRRRCAGAPGVGVLFSGGLDSAVLARLAHEHVAASESIDLINVAFGERGARDAAKAPDRLARGGKRGGSLSLQRVSLERWN